MIKAILFDVFGTIVDWRSGIVREAALFFDTRGIEIDAETFADRWRALYQPAMERIRTGRRGYVPLDILHRENLDIVLEELDLTGELNASDRSQLTRAWERLPPWPDSVPGLTVLKTHYAIAPCSNGSIALMTWLAKYGGLPWDAILGAEIARDYKPQSAVYLASVNALGLEPQQVMMVAAHNDDLVAAQAAGLQTGFIPRPHEHGPGQTTDLTPSGAWNVVGNNLQDLAQRILLED